MLDLIIGPLLEYTALGKANRAMVGGKEEVWYNSKIDITFGDTTTWLIGLGRITNVCGPDLKIIADWTFFIDKLMGKVASKLPKTKEFLDVLSGTGGSTDVIFGVKDLINYGHTQDTNIIRKNTAPLEIKIFKDKLKSGESLFPKALIALIVLPYLTLLTIVVTSRFAYMQVGVFSEKNLRDEVRGALNLSAPLIESRWVACLMLYEKLTYAKDVIQKKVDEIDKLIKDSVDRTRNELLALNNFPRNIFITNDVPNQIKAHLQTIQNYMAKQVDSQTKAFNEAIDALKISVPHLGEPKAQNISSNVGLNASYYSLDYNAIDWIGLKVTKNVANSPTKLFLGPQSAYLSASGAEITIGDVGLNNDFAKGAIIIQSKEDKGYVHLISNNPFSDINIKNDSLTIRSGTNIDETPTIALADGSLKIGCGPGLTGPKILFDNGKMMITAGDQTPKIGTGPKFIMTNDSIELTVGVGPAQSALKISSAGIEITCGGTTSTTWKATGIDMEAAENKIQISLAKIQENAVMAEENTQAIIKLKSTLESLEVNLKNIKADMAINA